MKQIKEMTTQELIEEVNEILNNDQYIDTQANVMDEDLPNYITICGIMWFVEEVKPGPAPRTEEELSPPDYAAHITLVQCPMLYEIIVDVERDWLEEFLLKQRAFCYANKISLGE